ncbi:MAG: hypothetical protein H6810_03665 [Phycisphaeraceae bacterium]|nr:MAG: hypothetical protein H6810_03665 [Phycisphaeraceae bacterium]
MRTLNQKLAVLMTMLAACLAAPFAAAKDVVVLDDGRRVTGDIVREIEGNVWMLVYFGDIKKQEFFSAASVKEIIRDAVADVAEQKEAPDKDVSKPGTLRGEVITLEGMVGVEFASKHLESLIPQLEKDIGEGGILVLKVNSGGGALLEIKPLSDTIENELKPRFEVVGWIESAISAAAMTSMTMERLYFLPEGNFGACTGWYGQLTAVKGRGLEETKELMRMITARGKRDYRIMEAMQGNPDKDTPLSATVDPDGTVHWYSDEDSGKVLVNPAGEILTFNSVQAEKLRFSEGIARNLDELAQEMGYDEVEWVGKWQSDLIFPVGRAEAENRRWRDFVSQDNQKLELAVAKYQLYLGTARSVQGKARGIMVNKARGFLRDIRRFYSESPNSILFTLNLTPDDFELWYEQQDEILRDLMRP